MLPCAAKSGRATPFIDALFTATSATCVTGLVTVGTAVHWSLFGKCVILLLIQIGGLGFMSVMTATSLLLRRTITLRERMVIGAGFGLDSSGGIVRLMRRVLVGTFLFEGVGAALLSIRFVQQFGPLRGVGMGVFHAVSAFCNGGFDLMGTPDDPFCSLVHYAEDPLVSLTIMALIVLGGLGFFVFLSLNDIALTEGMRLKYGYKKPQTPFFVKFPALNRQPAASEKRRAVIRSEAAEIAFRNVKLQ